MKITFYALTILFFFFLFAPHYSEGSNSKYPTDQRQESIIIAANESSDLPLIINEVKKIFQSGTFGESGYSVAVFEDLAVIGDPSGEGKEVGSGVAYVYRRVSGSNNWIFVKKLIADDGVMDDRFGFSVDINGDFILVGAPARHYISIYPFDVFYVGNGSAYMFYRNQGGTDNWGQVAKLTPKHPIDIPNDLSLDEFGYSVALGYGVQFKTALVGAPADNYCGDDSGAAFLFNEGNQIKMLTAPDCTGGERFGSSVAYTDNWFNWIVVGAPGDFNSSAKQTGSAYLFERDWGSPNSWGFNGKITPSDGDDGDTFGRSVAISGDTVVIGAPYALMSYGATYVFKPLLFSWIQAKKLMPTDGEDYYYFGSSVAVEGDAVAVGAPAFTTPGWGYVFKRNQGGTDNWGQHSRLAASNGEIGDNLGASIDISGSTVIAGAPSYANSGAAYFFDLPETKGIIKAKPWIPLLLLDD